MKKITYLFFFSLTLLFSNHLVCMEIVPMDNANKTREITTVRELRVLADQVNFENLDQELKNYSVRSSAIEEYVSENLFGKNKDHVIPLPKKYSKNPELVKEVIQEIYDKKNGISDTELDQARKNFVEMLLKKIENKEEQRSTARSENNCSRCCIATTCTLQIISWIGILGALVVGPLIATGVIPSN